MESDSGYVGILSSVRILCSLNWRSVALKTPFDVYYTSITQDYSWKHNIPKLIRATRSIDIIQSLLEDLNVMLKRIRNVHRYIL